MSATGQTAPAAPSFYQQAVAWLKNSWNTVKTDIEVDWNAVEPTLLADAEGIVEQFLGTAISAALTAAQAGLSGQEHFSQVKTQVVQAVEGAGKTASNNVINDVVSLGSTLANLVKGQIPAPAA